MIKPIAKWTSIALATLIVVGFAVYGIQNAIAKEMDALRLEGANYMQQTIIGLYQRDGFLKIGIKDDKGNIQDVILKPEVKK